MKEYWPVERWAELERRVTKVARPLAINATGRAARKVLREFSGSFFLVTRFLPRHKRTNVERIYAAVRYPDEVVDTFPLDADEKHARLDWWECHYEQALQMPNLRSSLRAGVPWILAGFADVVRKHSIPQQHYRSFLDAMRRDIEPAPFANLDDLTTNYVYGSAIVVGYFLAHVYSTAEGASLADAYEAAANLGIALQLTNFCRDISDDRRRGRCYVPADWLEAYGLDGAVVRLGEEADARYERAAKSLDVFAEDTRAAIRACIEVYRLLNRRILLAGSVTGLRQTVPIAQKLGALPAAKYWRIPLAYLGAL